ncbi:unnamed protein product, partial [Didymodactylos carnosus]
MSQLNCCEEHNCRNVQNAICLHCNHRLCTDHIKQHGQYLLDDAHRTCDELNELVEYTNVRSKDTGKATIIEQLNEWRISMIDDVEKLYLEKLQYVEQHDESINNRLDQFKENLEERLRQIRAPLEQILLKQTTNKEELSHLKQMLGSLKTEIDELQWKIDISVNKIDLNQTILVKPKGNNKNLNSVQTINPSDSVLLNNYASQNIHLSYRQDQYPQNHLHYLSPTRPAYINTALPIKYNTAMNGSNEHSMYCADSHNTYHASNNQKTNLIYPPYVPSPLRSPYPQSYWRCPPPFTRGLQTGSAYQPPNPMLIRPEPQYQQCYPTVPSMSPYNSTNQATNKALPYMMSNIDSYDSVRTGINNEESDKKQTNQYSVASDTSADSITTTLSNQNQASQQSMEIPPEIAASSN